MAGGETVQFNNSTYLAEKASVDRDFALTYFLRENKCFPPIGVYLVLAPRRRILGEANEATPKPDGRHGIWK